MRTGPIRVLVVDDSAFARKVIREVLSRDPGIDVVGIARDGLEALEKISELKPDVVTLDLIMPDLDGLSVLRALKDHDAPRVIVVSISGSESEIAVEALQNGAVEVVTKPTPLATDRLYELRNELVEKVKAAAIAKPRHRTATPAALKPAPVSAPKAASACKLIVIGTSTGGPQALTDLFKALPSGLPVPMAIALHIPAGYTGPLAARLDQASAVTVREAKDGMELLPGQAVIAPGGMHLRIRSVEGKFFASVTGDPADSLYRPSVDVLFESAAQAAGSGAMGVIMTGMGDDGLRGSGAIRAAGGRLLAESESSCVVYGMPRSVIEAGLTDANAPLESLPRLIVERL